MLKRLKLIKRGLQAMVISHEWSSYRLDDIEQANSMKEYILNDEWWDKFVTPTSHVYTLVYEMWDAMIEIYKKEKRPTSQISCFYDVVHRIVVARWVKNHSLHPRYYSDAWLLEDSTKCAPHRDGEISQEMMKRFRRLFPNDDEYAMFSMKTGPFEDLTIISKMGTMEPQELVTLAFRLLGQPTSSSCAERNWSTYAFIHLVKRNKLTTSRAQELVYIYNNLRLLSRNPNADVKMWDVGGDAFDSMEDVGFLEVADLSLDEPDFENDLLIDKVKKHYPSNSDQVLSILFLDKNAKEQSFIQLDFPKNFMVILSMYKDEAEVTIYVTTDKFVQQSGDEVLDECDNGNDSDSNCPSEENYHSRHSTNDEYGFLNDECGSVGYSKNKKGPTMKVKKFVDTHSCTRSNMCGNKHATQGWIADVVTDKLKSNGDVSCAELKRWLMRNYNVDVPYMRAFRGKRTSLQ
ncbi:hypothetical protein OSB04_005760 [Centaurea solstitialis]|uniref:HAT C-terminal dimerisation domain-containing protein n=1 Tax=Centaurea solstitialis TaxID=347529 RepID=A0AA38WPX2_9ASTR|nr:hypothetical protein OSB04_005760 [Centaurea solstitialis]